MEEIEKLTKFAIGYFNVNEMELYGKKRTSELVIARMFILYALHVEYKVTVGKLRDEFFRDRRAIFRSISKLRCWIQTQRYYREMYESFIDGYKKSHTD